MIFHYIIISLVIYFDLPYHRLLQYHGDLNITCGDNLHIMLHTVTKYIHLLPLQLIDMLNYDASQSLSTFVLIKIIFVHDLGVTCRFDMIISILVIFQSTIIVAA